MEKGKSIKKITIGLFVLALFLVVGYSFVSTNLITGGSSSILFNDTDFILEYHGYGMNNCNKRTGMNKNTNSISCQTDYMNDLGDDIYFGFALINRSYKYDAEVTVNLSVIDPNTNTDYTSHFTYEFDDRDFGTNGYRVLARDERIDYINIYYDNEFEINHDLNYIITFDIKPSDRTVEATNEYLEGDIYKIGNEEFYIMSYESKKLTLLSKYGLNVGDHIYAGDTEGIQSSHLDVRKNIGDVKYYNNFTYWNNSSNYPGVYPKYVYDNHSNLYSYMHDYKNYLQNYVSDVTVRLVNKSDVHAFGCAYQTGCEAATDWVYSSTYWTGIAMDDQSIFEIMDSGSFTEIYPYATGECVLRPVIELTLP